MGFGGRKQGFLYNLRIIYTYNIPKLNLIPLILSYSMMWGKYLRQPKLVRTRVEQEGISG